MSGDLFAGQAHARANDPATSHAAAAAISPGLTDIQAQVAAYAKRRGEAGFTDAEMADDFGDQSSTLRTRRSELTDQGLIVDTGQTRTHGESDRRRIVWAYRDHAPAGARAAADQPPAAPRVSIDINASDRQLAREHGQKLIGFADGLARQGYVIADEIKDAGHFLQKLAR